MIRRGVGWFARLMGRSTGDILVLLIAVTICFTVIAVGAAGTVFAFIHPTADIAGPSRLIADIINTMIGLLAGFLAGTANRLPKRQSGDQNEAHEQEGQDDPADDDSKQQ